MPFETFLGPFCTRTKFSLGLMIVCLPHGSMYTSMLLFDISIANFTKMVVGVAVIQCGLMMFLTHGRVYHMENIEIGGPAHANCLCLVKSFGATITFTIFTALDSTLKEKNGTATVLFCLCGYGNLLLVMILFRIGIDYDITGSFLAASCGLVYELTRDLYDVAYLFFANWLLAALKALVLEGTFHPPVAHAHP
ncbi:PREDICTED: uncharacterized protein LOC109127490 [Camelina sativa]|uniref:Uncharacterized protein LOC109127490 n=1 Tax=Camelina sativa TaxID=90675 RepID=A0ABM1QM95_CAMSA|nr:PREDICTED: uncharacterized protein LOC109127490 [Camelina sativa]